jgi:predicted transposase YbfD/YdcC
MQGKPAGGIIKHFGKLTDPRDENLIDHKLIDIVVIALCGVICGADEWTAIVTFGRAKQEWFETFLELPNGIPSHDTFGRVFGALDPDEFGQCFLEWVQEIAEVTEGEVIAIDGKKLRRSHDKKLGKKAIHMVSAWATANHLVLGQVKTDEKSNEITAIPKLLEVLELKGCIVTIDAMGCQTEIAGQIVEQEADYTIALKKNQGHLYEDVAELFAHGQEVGFRNMVSDYHRTINKNRGRIEIRECWTLTDLTSFNYIRNLSPWKGLQTVAMVKSQRRVGGKTSEETRYYISSLPNEAELLLAAIRSHWGIENSLHWVLDVAFREDDSRVRKDNAAENLATLRHVAVNLLKQEQMAQVGIKTKRLKAGWSEAYLLRVLGEARRF